jgi:hypothetical protein
MLKKTITYEDFDGNQRTDVFYFNLTKTELTEMETSVEGGMKNLLEKMVESEDVKEMFVFFKQIIVKSVGIKSDDGRRFMKSDEIANDFVSSAAFDSLFMELAQDANKAADFIKGMLPQDLTGSFEEQMQKTTAEAGLAPVPSPQND